MQQIYKYKAFISYSHQDEKFGKWLHKSLEKYKIPKGLREDNANLPEKLYPIFRDREELPTSADLSKNITEALRNSKYLIVICSVNSAKSFWVNQEIIDFKSMHGEDRILAIILDGEPHAKTSDKFDNSLECFPKALKFRVIDGALSQEQTEPIAGDVREGKDGREFAKLKLIAGLLGVGFEELYRREGKRKKNFIIIWFSIISIVLVLISVLAIKSYIAEKKVQVQLYENYLFQGFSNKNILKSKHYFAKAIENSFDKGSKKCAKISYYMTNDGISLVKAMNLKTKPIKIISVVAKNKKRKVRKIEKR